MASDPGGNAIAMQLLLLVLLTLVNAFFAGAEMAIVSVNKNKIKMLAEKGDIAEEMMYNTFNMGIGMVVAVDEKDVDATIKAMKEAGDEAFVVGYVEAGEKGVTLC